MTATLDQQLIVLCRMHNLDSIEIAAVANTAGKRPRFDVYVRRGGKMQSDRLYGDSITAAFKDALERLERLEEAAPIEFAPMEASA